MNFKQSAAILTAFLLSLLPLQGAQAALLKFKSDTATFTRLDASTFEAELLPLSGDYLFAEGAAGQIWVKQDKVRGDLIGEVVFAGFGSDFHYVGTMNPRHNGWQKFSIDPFAFSEQLYGGLLLRFENGGDGFATPTKAFYKLFGINQVPIPSAAWLLGFGLIGLVGLRRKFKH